MTINPQSNLFIELNPSGVICQNEWTVNTIPAIASAIEKIKWPSKGKLSIDGSQMTRMDSSGAWEFQKLIDFLSQRGLTIDLQGFTPEQQKLFKLVKEQAEQFTEIPKAKQHDWLTRVGMRTVEQLLESIQFLSFIGEIAIVGVQILRSNLKRIRFPSIMSIIESTGYDALPIIALLAFMIGVVVTYQMGVQLRNYGANIFIVDLLGMSVLREFGPLLTAIMVAGRTGSAFTAQLGTMKINEEIDALTTMGITPAELLVLPRIAGLFIALPLLTVWSDIFGIIGGMVMAKSMLNIGWYDFLHHFGKQVPLSSLLLGIGKAPVFALLIASIGCFQGIQVRGGADSVGRQTTKSVVQSIFFILTADAIFSVIFNKFGL